MFDKKHKDRNLLSNLVDYSFVCASKLKVKCRWLIHKEGKAHKLPGPLIVSLTSYPPRFSTLPLTLKCLLTQTIKPDRIILWIAHNDKDLLTEDITCLESHNLEIMYCDDIKSYKKIVPSLHVERDAFIVSADDDVYYWQTWLEALVGEYSDDNSEVLCHRAHKVLMRDNAHPLPYNDWALDIKDNVPSPFVFPTGMGGVMYPPNVFHSDVFETESFMSICPLGDDIWLYWMARRNGGKARKVGVKRRFILWPGTEATSLWNINRLPDGNDLKINSMMKKYGFPL